MSQKHCGKHDVIFPEGGSCWCCDQEKKATKSKAKKQEDVSPSTAGGDAS